MLLQLRLKATIEYTGKDGPIGKSVEIIKRIMMINLLRKTLKNKHCHQIMFDLNDQNLAKFIFEFWV